MDNETGHGEEHARRHPLGRVPVLESDEGLVFESAALCLHIADVNPEAGLIPPVGSHDRARIYQWSFYAMTELEPAMIAAVRARRAGDAAASEAAAPRLEKVFVALDNALAGNAYVTGDQFTVADVVVGGVCMSARQYDVLPETRHVGAYLERLDARPAKQRAFAD
jgi:glutathione S-transferase